MTTPPHPKPQKTPSQKTPKIAFKKEYSPSQNTPKHTTTSPKSTTTSSHIPLSHKEHKTEAIASEGLHLREAILRALQRSRKISAKREKVIQAKRALEEKLAAYKPTLNLNANVAAVTLNSETDGVVKYTKMNGAVTLKENLYAGGKDANEISRAKANLRVAQEKFASEVEEEALKVIDAYYSLIYEKRGIQINRENMESLKKILDIVQIKEKNGAATRGDLNYIKSQHENASAALVKAESRYQNSIALYEYYIGKLSDQTKPADENFTFEEKSLTQLTHMMYTHNTKLQIAKAKLDAEEFNLEAIKAKFRPTIDLSLSAKAKKSHYAAEPRESRGVALLSFNYNLYNGGKDRATLLRSKSKTSELHYILTDLRESLEYNLKQMYENTRTSRDTMSHTQKEVQANMKVTHSYWNAFKYGTQDIQALLLAQRALNRSQLDLIKEEKAYVTNNFKLLREAGILLATLRLEDFVDPNKMYQNDHFSLFSDEHRSEAQR